MKKHSIRLVSLLVIASVLSLLLTVNIFADTKTLTVVRLANLKYGISCIPHEIGINKGIFKKHGIDLQVLNFDQGGPAAAAAAASGQVDLGSFGTPILTSIAKGIPIKIIAAPPVKTNEFILVGKPSIKSVSELKGKTILTGAVGGGNRQALLKILQGNGLTEADVNILASGGADAFQVLSSGKVDAAIASEPDVTRIVKAKLGKIITPAQKYFGNYEHSFVFATNDFIKSNPEAVRKFLKASRESYEYVKSHRAEAIKYTLTKVNITEDVAKSYFNSNIPRWDLTFKINLKGTENAVKILQGFGDIDKSVKFDAKTWLDLSFLK